MLEKSLKYNGEKECQENDTIKIPFIKVNEEINYDELCGRYIKDSKMYLVQALQTIDFDLTNYGGSVISEAAIQTYRSTSMLEYGRKFIFNTDFLLYIKESDKQIPYFALKVDDIKVLQSNKK